MTTYYMTKLNDRQWKKCKSTTLTNAKKEATRELDVYTNDEITIAEKSGHAGAFSVAYKANGKWADVKYEESCQYTDEFFI